MQLAIIFIIAVAGVVAFFAPTFKRIRRRVSNRSGKKGLKSNTKEAEHMHLRALKHEEYDDPLEMCREYNEALGFGGQEDLKFDLPTKGKLFDIGGTVFGSITVSGTRETRFRKREVDRKEQTYYIYLTASHMNLANGFCVMPGTSIPIGGKNTLSVLYGEAKQGLFEKSKPIIEIGDYIELENLYDTLFYEVTDTGILTKDDVDYLKIADGKDEIALLLYLPHRNNYIVFYGERITEEDFEDDDEYDEES